MNDNNNPTTSETPDAEMAPEDFVEVQSTPDETDYTDEDTLPNDASQNGSTPAQAVDEADATEPITDDDQPNEEGQSELKKLRAEVEKNLAGWQRERAEFQNFKRRIEREQRDLKERSSLEIIEQLLPIIDDFERAMDNVPEELASNPWLNGVSLIQGKFQKLLDAYSVEVIDPVGEPFDPNHHQAISKDDSDDYESDHVIQTLQKGYISGKTLLRPALVRVAN